MGRYEILGTLEVNSCGPGFGANRTVRFTAEIRDDEGVGYWLFGDARPTPGELDDDGKFYFEQHSGWELVSAKPEIGYGGCQVTQREAIDGRVARIDLALDSDAGVEDVEDDDEDIRDFAAESLIDVIPVAGDDCSPALSTNGGPLLALPCRLQYTLSGERMADPADDAR